MRRSRHHAAVAALFRQLPTGTCSSSAKKAVDRVPVLDRDHPQPGAVGRVETTALLKEVVSTDVSVPDPSVGTSFAAA
jgi:hypothetical protein